MLVFVFVFVVAVLYEHMDLPIFSSVLLNTELLYAEGNALIKCK